MDVFELYFKCTEEGKGDHCVYCWFGPTPACQRRLYLEFRRQVRMLLCPFKLGDKVYVLKYAKTPYMRTKICKGFVYQIKNVGKGWRFSVKSPENEYVGTFKSDSINKTVFRSLAAAEEAKKGGKKDEKQPNELDNG